MLETHSDMGGYILKWNLCSHRKSIADMQSATRHLHLVLLLILVISHVCVAAHAATHVPGELGQCELCISYGNATAAVAHHDDQCIPLVRGADPIQCVEDAVHSTTILVTHPRGPPVSS